MRTTWLARAHRSSADRVGVRMIATGHPWTARPVRSGNENMTIRCMHSNVCTGPCIALCTGHFTTPLGSAVTCEPTLDDSG